MGDGHGANAGSRSGRGWAFLGTGVFLVLAPGTFDVLVPWWISRWRVHAAFPGFWVMRVLGGLVIAAAVPVVLESFARFALQGGGTPAPVFPTQRLVVSGFYRYVRNPMYVAVVSIVLGQALLFGDVRVLAYGVVAWLATHLFVVGYEEPTLRRTFGAEYEEYCAHVPRWVPRLRAWQVGAK
jgi:protein-S-isoprenylcysteine O-methyltransferase Ste14